VSALPRGWTQTTLGAIGEYLNGRGFKKIEWRDSGRPIIRIQNLTGTSQEFNYFQGEPEEGYVAREGDLLVSWAATLGVFVWDGPEAVINQHIFKVQSHIDQGFHRYLLQSVLGDLKRQTHGSGMVHITKSRFESTPVLLPPHREQARIVTAIEEQFSRLDGGVAALERVRQNLKRMKAAILRASLQGIVVASDTTQWEQRSLSDVVTIASGQTPKGLQVATAGPTPYYKVGDMNSADGMFMTESRAYIDPSTAERFGLHIRPAGTVIFPKRGGAIATNKKRILRVPSAYDLNTIGLVPGPEIDSRFLYIWISAIDLSTLADGSNVPQINHGDLSDLLIHVPPKDEQGRIVEAADRYLDRVRTLETVMERALQRSERIRASILSSAFTGRLVPQSSTTGQP
jgi:type I restriction enzyme S subunit